MYLFVCLLLTVYFQVQAEENLSKEHKEILYRFAPIIIHDISKDSNRHSWDFPTTVDFDGDLVGNNNEENIRSNKFTLPATVYYAFLETESHFFLTYSLFHPLDWSSWPSFIPYTWHENDMESLQIVVAKGSPEKVVLLATQAHTKTHFYTTKESGISAEEVKLSNHHIIFMDKSLNGTGAHCAVTVEKGGHGIYGLKKHRPPSELKTKFVFIPSVQNQPDLYKREKSVFRYQLKSTYETFWLSYLKKQIIGNGKLMDGTFDYKDSELDLKGLPRYFDSDRFCGPGKYDAGISPFAFSQSLIADDLGVLFFNPAIKYGKMFRLKKKWSRSYQYNSFLEDFKAMK